MQTSILLVMVALKSQIYEIICQIDEIIIRPRVVMYALLDFYLQRRFIYLPKFSFISLHANRRVQNYTTVTIVSTHDCKERHLEFSHVKRKITNKKVNKQTLCLYKGFLISCDAVQQNILFLKHTELSELELSLHRDNCNLPPGHLIRKNRNCSLIQIKCTLLFKTNSNLN